MLNISFNAILNLNKVSKCTSINFNNTLVNKKSAVILVDGSSHTPLFYAPVSTYNAIVDFNVSKNFPKSNIIDNLNFKLEARKYLRVKYLK